MDRILLDEKIKKIKKWIIKIIILVCLIKIIPS